MIFTSSKLISIVFTIIIAIHSTDSLHQNRNKRFLIYPRSNPTRLQFVAGFGIPYESNFEAITSGYVIRTQYFMPFNATHLYPIFLNNRTIDVDLLDQGILNTVKRSVENQASGSRVNEKYLQNFGTNERYFSNVEVVEESPLTDSRKESKNTDYHNRWNFYDLVMGAMTHKGYEGKVCLLRSICEAVQVNFSHQSGILGELLHILLNPSTSNDFVSRHSDNEFYFAEQAGLRGDNCEVLFKDCSISILELFSGIYETTLL